MSAKLKKKNLNLLAQYRSFDLGADPRIFLLSASLDFEVSKNVKPGFGLMYLDIFSYIGENKKKTRNKTLSTSHIKYVYRSLILIT